VYGGTETNESDDFVVAGISQKIGGKSTPLSLHFFDSPERAASTMRKGSLVWKTKSAKIVSTHLVELVHPKAQFMPPEGWDLDCFIRRDGTAKKFKGKLAFIPGARSS
jgi:hypothetical protein